MRRKWRTGPLPDASQLTPAGKSAAVLNDWDRMPVSKANVAVVEINKHWLSVHGSVISRGRSIQFIAWAVSAVRAIDAVGPVSTSSVSKGVRIAHLAQAKARLKLTHGRSLDWLFS